MTAKRKAIKYLNTDLDLESSQDLRPLARALVRHDMIRLYVGPSGDGRWGACLEANKMARTPSGHIGEILKAVESLTGRVKALWEGCLRRDCNIGYDCGEHPPHGRFNHHIPHRTLQRMANAGLAIRITLYPPFENPAPEE